MSPIDHFFYLFIFYFKVFNLLLVGYHTNRAKTPRPLHVFLSHGTNSVPRGQRLLPTSVSLPPPMRVYTTFPS